MSPRCLPFRSCYFLSIVIASFVLALPVSNVVAQSVNPTPFLNELLFPSSAQSGSPGLTLTVTGAGFVSNSVVKWNGVALITTYVGVDTLQADVPSSDLTTANTASVTVFSPTPGGGASNVVPFTIRIPTTSVTLSPSLHEVSVTPVNGLVTGDFNGDGIPDLAVFGSSAPSCGETSGAISILLGNGHGGFTTKSTICSDESFPSSGLVADFNNDGKLDLAVISGPDCMGCAYVTIYLGNGDGTFTDRGSVLPGLDGGYRAIAAADFNGDGKLDLAVSYIGDYPVVEVLLGNGDGSFSGGSELASELDSVSLALGDFNNDGIIDIASSGSGGVGASGQVVGPLSVWLGNSNGTFTLAAPQPDVTGTGSVIAGDFNGDGNLDLVASGLMLLGNGNGTFTQGSVLPSCNAVAAADLNGDGNLDLVCGNGSILLGSGNGTFQTGYLGQVGDVVADFNGTGLLDLAAPGPSDSFVILRQTVPTPHASIALSSGQDPSTVNQPVTYTAVVSASPYSPTGSVTFTQGANQLGTVPLVDGQASITPTFTTPGSFSIVAVYSGDQYYKWKDSNVVQQIVNKYTTTTNLYSNPQTSAQGQPVTFTATVSSSGPLAAGNVTFRTGNTVIGIANLVNGVATLRKSNLPPGTLSITATYQGNAESQESTSAAWMQYIN